MGSIEHSDIERCNENPENETIFTFHCHYRVVDDKLKDDVYPEGKNEGKQVNPQGIVSHGGCTVAAVQFGNEFHWGVSRCNSRDIFNKRKGRVRSYGLARSRSAAITPALSLDQVKEVANEFARVAFETKKENGQLIVPEFDDSIKHLFEVRNTEFNQVNLQQELI